MGRNIMTFEVYALELVSVRKGREKCLKMSPVPTNSIKSCPRASFTVARVILDVGGVGVKFVRSWTPY